MLDQMKEHLEESKKYLLNAETILEQELDVYIKTLFKVIHDAVKQHITDKATYWRKVTSFFQPTFWLDVSTIR